jgi:hypothetical protein
MRLNFVLHDMRIIKRNRTAKQKNKSVIERDALELGMRATQE